MSNWKLLLVGLAGILIGAMPGGSPLPIFLAVHVATIGGAMVILAALRFPFALVIGWPKADVLTGLIAIAQYFVYTSAYGQSLVTANKFYKEMFAYWSEVLALCGIALLLIVAAGWFRATIWPRWRPNE